MTSLAQLSAASDMREFLAHVFAEILRVTGASNVAATRYDPRTNQLRLELFHDGSEARWGVSGNEIEIWSSPYDADVTPAFQIGLKHRHIFVASMLKDQAELSIEEFALPGGLEWMTAIGASDAAVSILFAGNEPVGTFHLHFTSGRTLRPDDLPLLNALPEGSCLYQYTRVMSGFDLPRQKQYANEVTETFAGDRLSHLDKTAGFRRIDLHWCLTLEPSTAKAFERKPQENAVDTSRMLSDLEKTATLLEGHLGSSLGLKLLGKAEVFQFFSYLFNLEEWAGRDQLRADTGVDRQIVSSPVAWHSDHVQIGKRHVQMFSLKTTPEASRPCLFSGLLTLDCDSVLCSTWRVKSTSAARSEIDAQEKFISFFKVGVLTRVMSGRDSASLDTGAGAKAANNNVDDLSEVIRSLDKKAQGDFSLRLLLAARSAEQLRDIVPTVHRVFVDARAQVMEETLGNLSAFYAMFPGNHKFNVFPLWLAEDHHARLSSVFAPHIGHPHSEDLDSEYLNIFETRTRTPFFQDVYVDGVRVMLIIGPTGTGKSVHGNQIISLEQKYGGFTYIFDIGGSYESVVELYGGRVDRVGKDGPRVNPFALEPTESNVSFRQACMKPSADNC